MPYNFGAITVAPTTLLKKLELQLKQSGTPSGSNLVGAGLADRAFLSLYADEVLLADPPATQFVTIRPTNFPIWQGVVDGAGREQTGFNAGAIITCFAQISSDPETKNTNAISEEALSVTSFVMGVVSALQFWTPKDSDLNDYLREPARVDTSGLQFTPVTGKGGPWVKASFPYQFKFAATLP